MFHSSLDGLRWGSGFVRGGWDVKRTTLSVGGAHWFGFWGGKTKRGGYDDRGTLDAGDDDETRTLVLAFFTAPSSISTPTPLAPAFAAAVTSTLPSLHPRSYTTSAAVTPATASISSTIFWGVALMGPR